MTIGKNHKAKETTKFITFGRNHHRALLRLYKITKNEIYLELSYQCLAAIFRNTQIWVDPKLWIALEDLQDGWEKSGTVGQEVYSAGNAFGILPRHYLQVPGETFLIYVDYPTSGYKAVKDKNIHFFNPW